MKLTTNKILSIIAHDLKDPLTSISGISDILLHNWNDFPEEEKTDILNDIRDTSDSALKLLTELLDWSRKVNAFTEPERKDFNAGREIGILMAAAGRKARYKKLALTNEVPPEVPMEGDVNMFNAVFRNLLANAIKSCQEEGKITVSATRGGKNWEFCIADSGVGMTSRQVEILFSGESPASGDQVPENYGNGFGLILCRDFIRLAGGRLWAESREGTGTRVHFTFQPD